MKWKISPQPKMATKVYEALGAVADGRVEGGGDGGKVYSSNRNKFYTITYDPIEQAIMSNDNGAFWHGDLGYPALAFLFKIGVLEYRAEYAEHLKEILWKKINTDFKSNYAKTKKYCDDLLIEKGVDISEFHSYVDGIIQKATDLKLGLLGKKIPPPAE